MVRVEPVEPHQGELLQADANEPLRAVGFMLSSLGFAVAKRFRETLAPLSLEPKEFAVMRSVSAAEGQTQQAIGDRLGIPASRMVAFVDALEARGLLERRPNPHDRRARALYVTPAGRELLERALALAVGLEAHMCDGLSAAQREQLIELLQLVGAQLGIAPGVHAATHSALADEVACAPQAGAVE